MSGPLGFGRALSTRLRLVDFCHGTTVVVGEDETLTKVVAATLARPVVEQHDDVVVVDQAGTKGIAQVATVLAALAKEYAEQALHDPLTGLGNRSLLVRLAEHALLDDGMAGRRTGLLVLDLDRFKDVNDTLGHEAGDELLRQVGGALRASSTVAGGVATRLGGDEFAVILPGLQLREDDGSDDPLDALANRLRRSGEKLLAAAAGPFALAGSVVTVEGSVGAAWSPDHGVDLATLLRRADSAMYQAKRERTRVQVWSPMTMNPPPVALTLLTQLKRAVPAGQLRLHYQPVVDARTGAMDGAEALVRWYHPQRGLLPPGAFLSIAESSDVIHELTDWVMDKAIAQAATWAEAGRPLPVAVNLSARMLIHDDLPARVGRLLDKHSLAPHLLTLEVTESAVMTQPGAAAGRLADLRTLGVRVALDDFGTGFTSLSMLAEMDFDELKVDQVFIAEATKGGASAAIVHSVLDLGHRLGLQVVAEGVEDEPTAAFLRRLGYDRLQGYLYGRPTPAAELDAARASADPAPHVPHRTPRRVGRPLHPPVPLDEADRLSAVRALTLDDPALRQYLDDIAGLAAQICATPVALVTVVAENQQLHVGRHGTTQESTPREHAFCAHTICDRDVLEVPDARRDVRFANNPSVTSDMGLRFYAGAPLVSGEGGSAIGAVCVLDHTPRNLAPDQHAALETLARLAAERLTSAAKSG